MLSLCVNWVTEELLPPESEQEGEQLITQSLSTLGRAQMPSTSLIRISILQLTGWREFLITSLQVLYRPPFSFVPHSSLCSLCVSVPVSETPLLSSPLLPHTPLHRPRTTAHTKKPETLTFPINEYLCGGSELANYICAGYLCCISVCSAVLCCAALAGLHPTGV